MQWEQDQPEEAIPGLQDNAKVPIHDREQEQAGVLIVVVTNQQTQENTIQ